MGSDGRVETPWEKSMGVVPMHISYFDGTLYEALERTAGRYPDYAALRYLGTTVSFRAALERTRLCARALRAQGIGAGDVVTVALPNCPQAVYLLYGLSAVGAVANLIYPLSAEGEIAHYMQSCGARWLVTAEQFYPVAARACRGIGGCKILTTGMGDELPLLKRLTFKLRQRGGTRTIPSQEQYISWKTFLRGGKNCAGTLPRAGSAQDAAVILHTGGTTGTPKGAVLTGANINAQGQQLLAANPMAAPGDKILAALPLCHGFGLGVCIHAAVLQGICSILIPRFSGSGYGREIVGQKCNFIAGVPTLYGAMIRQPALQDADLSFFKGLFCGGDALPAGLKERIDAFLFAHNSPVPVREGYGTTETVAACCLNPPHRAKPGSVGVPFPDMLVKVVQPGTDRTLPPGEVGELLVSGPTVMRAYLGQRGETERALRLHDDGQRWFYTGDLGHMDADGFVFFDGRVKRMIVTSGNNVYPGQVEAVLEQSGLAAQCCVIGVPDAHRMQRIKAFVVPAAGVTPTEETRARLLAHCAAHLSGYALPSEIEFRDSLPVTRYGKVAFHVLETEEAEKGNKN